MRRIAVLPILGLAVLAAIATADGPGDRDSIVHAKKMFAGRCASCHFVPDPIVERDKVWLGLIKTTA